VGGLSGVKYSHRASAAGARSGGVSKSRRVSRETPRLFRLAIVRRGRLDGGSDGFARVLPPAAGAHAEAGAFGPVPRELIAFSFAIDCRPGDPTDLRVRYHPVEGRTQIARAHVTTLTFKLHPRAIHRRCSPTFGRGARSPLIAIIVRPAL